ncbi:MAG: helix-turn-helix domain-containing protein [Chitinispirillaceae bacterium]
MAELLRASKRTVRYWAKDGPLPCVYLCREIRFRHEDIEKAMREGIEPKENKIPSIPKKKI